MAAALLLTGTARASAEPPAAPQAPAEAAPQHAEIKLLVTVEHTAQAIQALKLDPQAAVPQMVCFFDTFDAALDRQFLILRARQKGTDPGQSTVKVRGAEGTTILSDEVRALPCVMEWIDEAQSLLSSSLGQSLPDKDQVAKVASGHAPAASLFTAAQQQLVTSRLPGFKWDSLQCYGPIQSQVWCLPWQARGFPKALTVELWHMVKDGRSQGLLEVSTKVRIASPAQAQALAKQFYAAAKTAGLGEPAGRTKTRLAMDFFQPRGRNP